MILDGVISSTIESSFDNYKSAEGGSELYSPSGFVKFKTSSDWAWKLRTKLLLWICFSNYSKSTSESTEGYRYEGYCFNCSGALFFYGFYTEVGLLLGCAALFIADLGFKLLTPDPILEPIFDTDFFGCKLLTRYFATFSGCTRIELFADFS